jgi:penicillin amidase
VIIFHWVKFFFFFAFKQRRLLLAFLLLSFPAAAERITTPGLHQPAEILLDRWGVPHIYAASQRDAFFVQGWNAARDRLWQIDTWRRRGLGLLSEVLGPGFVAQDRAARLFLYRGDMRAEWRSYSDDAEAVATAFAAGINAYVDRVAADPALLPVEFRLLGYAPSHWAAADVVRIRSHGLSRNVHSEVARARVMCRAGAAADSLRRTLQPARTVQVPQGLDVCSIPGDVLAVFDLATADAEITPARVHGDPLAPEPRQRRRHDPALYGQQWNPDWDTSTLGSNNWVVGPGRSATGRPILADDPHRGLAAPSLRYIAHLVAPGLDVIGAGEPGLPGISIGHNQTIGFGLTIFGIDQEDVYFYATNPADPGQYRYGDGWEDVRVVHEAIRVKGEVTRDAVLKFTRHGPVIREDPEHRRLYAVRAAWLQPGMAPYFASIGFMRAPDWPHFLAAMDRWGAPSENQVYADTSGNIGWVPGGMVPVRRNWDGLLPVPGDGRYEWDGFMARSLLPSAFNPAKGWFASANQMNLPSDYPIDARRVGFEWAYAGRYNRIAAVLEATPKATVADMARLQNDELSPLAAPLIGVLRGLATDDPELRSAIAWLGEWDGQLTAESPQGALFEMWFGRYLRRDVVAAVMPEPLRAAVWPGEVAAILALMQHPDARLGADPVATRDRVMLASLRAALTDISRELGADRTRWAWGRLHKVVFEDPIAAFADPALRAAMTVGPAGKSGSGQTVGAAAYRSHDFRAVAGASFRMVLDVGNWDASLAVNSPGQSGDPASAHFRDLFPLWLAGEYFPLAYIRAAVERATERRIELVPAALLVRQGK